MRLREATGVVLKHGRIRCVLVVSGKDNAGRVSVFQNMIHGYAQHRAAV